MGLTPEKCRGVFALVPACSTSNANTPDAKNTFERDSFAVLVDDLVRAGVHGIITTGSFGEWHTLTWEEHKQLIDTTVEVVNGRVPVVIGASSTSTREAIEKALYAIKAGADAIMNGPPMYLRLSLENAIQYYKDLSQTCPEIGIVVYHNPNMFKVTIPPRAWEKIKRIPTVVGVKDTIRDIRHQMEICRICGNRISVLVMDYAMFPAMMFGAKGCTSIYANMGPQPVLRLYEYCHEKNWEKAMEIAQDINIAWERSQVFMAEAKLDTMQLLVPWFKAAIDFAGYGRAGPARRPFAQKWFPKEAEESAKVFAQEWKKLVKKYS